MNPSRSILLLLLLCFVAMGLAGCATRAVNPVQPRPNTGYVDFYSDSSGELAWQVERFDDRAQIFKKVFSDLEPAPGRILRLAFAPGRHRLRILFLNCFVREPAVVEVEVKDGMITPVQVILTPEDAAQMNRKEQRIGATIKGRYGRSTKIRSEETMIFRVSVEVQTPTPYQVKERTIYAH